MARLVKIADLDEIPPGSAHEVEFEGKVIAIFNREGKLLAIDGMCAHQGGPLAKGRVADTTVSCPWHGWKFDLVTGRSSTDPRCCLPTYEVIIEGKSVLVSVESDSTTGPRAGR